MLMKKNSGLILSEIMTALLAVIGIIGVAFGLYVSHERDNMVESAKASIAAAKARVDGAVEGSTPIHCDDSLLEADTLSNLFSSLSITRTLITPELGYGPSMFVSSNKEADGNDTFVTAERLLRAIEKKDEYEFRISKDDDDEIEYRVLLSEFAVCEDTLEASAASY
ncbi:MAG: hypothetical protein ACJAVI_003431 [Candidatus Azotimanducaceae bacterium]|jgi:hypothetical protein